MTKIHIDFQIFDSNDPKKIIIVDTSIWAHIADKPAIIEIIPPGSKKPTTLYYDKNSVILLNSQNLGLSCTDCNEDFANLPDGIYEITVKGSPDKFNKKRYFLKTVSTISKLDDIVMRYYNENGECEGSSDDLNKVLRYKDLISVAETFVRKGHPSTAQDIIFKVQKIITKFNNCRKCPHKV